MDKWNSLDRVEEAAYRHGVLVGILVARSVAIHAGASPEVDAKIKEESDRLARFYERKKP